MTGFYNREGVCLLRGTDWILKNIIPANVSVDDLSSERRLKTASTIQHTGKCEGLVEHKTDRPTERSAVVS